MEYSRDQILAGSTLARDKHRGIRIGHLDDQLEDFHNVVVLADENGRLVLHGVLTSTTIAPARSRQPGMHVLR